LSSCATLVFFVAISVLFVNGYRQSGPARSKFQKLPGGVEDLAEGEMKPEGEDKILKELETNKKIARWTAEWKKCLKGFTLLEMDDVGESQIEQDPVEREVVRSERKGPGKMFYFGAPGGGRSINPFFRRLVYKKDESGWQPYIELPCSVLLYDAAKDEAFIVLTCSMYEGMQDAIWLDKNRVVLLGYESVSRQMDVRCETIETCVAPAIWVLDVAKGWLHSYRGDLISRGKCDVESYLRQRLPGFFGKH
jgi:hypothetical protein